MLHCRSACVRGAALSALRATALQCGVDAAAPYGPTAPQQATQQQDVDFLSRVLLAPRMPLADAKQYWPAVASALRASFLQEGGEDQGNQDEEGGNTCEACQAERVDECMHSNGICMDICACGSHCEPISRTDAEESIDSVNALSEGMAM